jgi:cytochrome c oxidase cbb3-type subunit 1
MVFSIMLWMPSWGGMINGLMTLSGAWDKLRTDPIMRMMVVSVAFYGMSTFEGPLMSIRAVNSLSHYTDWTIGHVHSGALGWVGMISFGAIYFLTPRLWNRSGCTPRHGQLALLARDHRHRALRTAMWVSGIMQGLMWRETNELGFLVYSFAETVEPCIPFYVIRVLRRAAVSSLGGLVMAFNIYKTIRGDVRSEECPWVPRPSAAPAE